MSHWELVGRILENGHLVPPLLQAPWVDSSIFRIDWLHCADQGVAADFLGNLLQALQRKCRGRNVSERMESLWQKVQDFYKAKGVEDRLQALTAGMVQQPKKVPSSERALRSAGHWCLSASSARRNCLTLLAPSSRR